MFEFIDVEEGLIFFGLVGLIDLLWLEVVEVIVECWCVGICVKMIIGDYVGIVVVIGK